MKRQKQWDLAPKLTIILVGLCILVAIFISFSQATIARADEPLPGGAPIASTEYFSLTTIKLTNGQSLDRYGINGPPHPPAGFELERAAVTLPKTAKTLTVPAYNWVFGCSAVSGSMIAAYYDRNGFTNMYTGPTGGGLMPLDNSTWGTWSDGYTTYPNIPLAASHNGVDGRTIKGSIDDYWVKYGSTANDPYIGHWTQHAWSTAIGDYMKTSQSAYGSTDGNTWFYNYNSSAKLTCAAMETAIDSSGHHIHQYDGGYGRKLFYQARGYIVTDCYNQNTDNNYAGGFTFAQYKAQIDAGRPVMLNLEGHTIVGVGYSDPSTVYIHDTWDYLTHSMTWGSSYSGMRLLSVSIVNIAKPVTVTATSIAAQDGWVLESSETSGVGGTMSSTGTMFGLGDSSAKRQYRGILSFNTGAILPDNAVITAVTLKVKKQGVIGGHSNPVTTFQGFIADIKNGYYGTSALQTSDFQATGGHAYGPYSTALSSTGWYNISLTAGKAYINKTSASSSLTQIRLRFNKDDDNDAVADYLNLYSGNTTTAANRPQLTITYYVP